MISIEDDLQLRNLMARYTDAVMRRDVEAWTATWAEDATWNLLGNPVTGRDNIVGLWQTMMQGFEFAALMPSSSLFEVDGDSASGHWYLHEYTRTVEGETATILSRYLDTYVRQDGQWLYQTREYNFIYNGPADLSGAYTALG